MERFSILRRFAFWYILFILLPVLLLGAAEWFMLHQQDMPQGMHLWGFDWLMVFLLLIPLLGAYFLLRNLYSRQHELQHAVLKRTAQFEAMIAALPDLMFEMGLDGAYYTIFARDADLLVASKQELLGRKVSDFMPPAATAIVLEALQEANSQGISAGRQLQLDTLSGCKWFEISVSRMATDSGEPRFIVLSREITTRKDMELAVQESAGKLKEAQRLAQVGSWELNLLTGKLSWSDEIFNLFEIDQNRFGATYEAFLQAIHPGDRELVNAAYTGSLKDQLPYQVRHRLRMPDGRIKWVEERCESNFADDGTPLLSRGTVQDITREKMAEDKLRESEERYQSVVAALGEGIILRGQDGMVLDVNESAQKLLGLNRAQLCGQQAIDPRWRILREDGSLFPPEAWPWEITLHTGQPQYNVMMGVHRADGSMAWITNTSLPIHLQGGQQPSMVVSSYVDITESRQAADILKKTNEELERRVELRTQLLRKAKEEAEHANISKSLFLTSMSHELRTPLNAILGYAQLMQMDHSLPPVVGMNAQEIQHAGEFLLNLMNDILDLSRIESGSLELKLESVPVQEIMMECGKQNARQAAMRKVVMNFTESCQTYNVYADRRALLQVMNNLVSNAIKYNREGGRVNVTCSEEIHGRLKIAVMDTGTGIAADKQSMLFQSFNRLGAEMSNIEGTGVGLVITRKLVEGMNGRIGVDTVHGLGSTFWVELTLMRNGLRANRTDQLSPVQRKVPRILVAEDYPPNQNVLTLQLGTLGYEVEIAQDGSEALLMWREQEYDLVLTDIDMPNMNGIELAQSIRREERLLAKHTPLLAITANNSSAERVRCLQAGMDEVLHKPLAMDALRTSLGRWLGDVQFAADGSAHFDGENLSANHATLPVLDIDYLYQILGQVNVGRACLLIDTFIAATDAGLHKLLGQADNLVAVAREMHKQKSSARTVGAMRYAEMAALLERQTRDENFIAVETVLQEMQQALDEVRLVAVELLESAQMHRPEQPASGDAVPVDVRSVLVVDDDHVVLQQVKSMLQALGVNEVLTAENGRQAIDMLAARKNEIDVLVCDLSMPEMDGVELIRRFSKSGFTGGIILISGADSKLLSTVNKLALLQGVRVLGQLQKPVNSAQLAVLLAHIDDLPVPHGRAVADASVSRDAIANALAGRKFSVWYQPKIEVRSQRVVGLEALARWELASGEFIPPDSFIAVAERENIIGALSRELMGITLENAAELLEQDSSLKIAINLSGTWLNDLSIPDFIWEKTRSAGVPAGNVIFEVTETGVLEDLTAALDVLTRLRLKGFGLSIDDFGIGYSSFEQLGRIPFTEMKLDRSFVSTGSHDAAARAILEGSMEMARKLGLSTVAEGVETEEDMALVRRLGCNMAQGYLIARPMPMDKLHIWLKQREGEA